MRKAALLLLLTLTAPSVARVVCDLGCIQAVLQVAQGAPDESCHQQQPANQDQLAVTNTDDACHANNDAIASSVATEPQAHKAALVSVGHTHYSIASHRVFSLSDWSSFLSPPDIVLITTQLRI